MLFDAAKQFIFGVEFVPFFLQRQISLVVVLDGVALGDEVFGLRDACLQILGILFELRHTSVQGVESLAQAGGFACAGFQVGQAFGETFFLGPERVEVGTFVADLRFDLGVLRLPLGLRLQRLRQPLDVQVGLLNGFAGVAIFAGGQLVEAFVTAQVEDAREDLLALAGTFFGELVRASLQQEGGVDERIVIEPDDVVDLFLRLAHGGRRQGPVLALAPLQQVQFQVRFARFARNRSPVGTNDPVALALDVEDKLDLHLPLSDADEVVVRLVATARFTRFAPERPRHGV